MKLESRFLIVISLSTNVSSKQAVQAKEIFTSLAQTYKVLKIDSHDQNIVICINEDSNTNWFSIIDDMDINFQFFAKSSSSNLTSCSTSNPNQVVSSILVCSKYDVNKRVSTVYVIPISWKTFEF